jgi:hypothetical protein
MKSRKSKQHPHHLSRIFASGREFATAKEFAEYLRTDELVQIHRWGI